MKNTLLDEVKSKERLFFYWSEDTKVKYWIQGPMMWWWVYIVKIYPQRAYFFIFSIDGLIMHIFKREHMIEIEIEY